VVKSATDAIKSGAVVLVLVRTIDEGKRLAERIPGAVAVYSRMGAKKRREAVADFRRGVLRCMIATSLADEGADFPVASVLVLASGGRSARLVEQRSGRVLRCSKGKDAGRIVDFIDTASPMLFYQSQARIKVYRELGYEII
jgi:superfamily II DNA or RNA helicase